MKYHGKSQFIYATLKSASNLFSISQTLSLSFTPFHPHVTLTQPAMKILLQKEEEGGSKNRNCIL
jgi:hypothetical protein